MVGLGLCREVYLDKIRYRRSRDTCEPIGKWMKLVHKGFTDRDRKEEKRPSMKRVALHGVTTRKTSNWIHMSQFSFQWRTLVYTVMNLLVL
jgi:hypothetical protein